MEFCHFRDFAIPLLGFSTRHPSIHEMRATRLVDSSFRAPHLPDAAGMRLCLVSDDFTIYWGQIRMAAGNCCVRQLRVGRARGNVQSTHGLGTTFLEASLDDNTAVRSRRAFSDPK
jgi:hypothetical protein